MLSVADLSYYVYGILREPRNTYNLENLTNVQNKMKKINNVSSSNMRNFAEHMEHHFAGKYRCFVVRSNLVSVYDSNIIILQ